MVCAFCKAFKKYLPDINTKIFICVFFKKFEALALHFKATFCTERGKNGGPCFASGWPRVQPICLFSSPEASGPHLCRSILGSLFAYLAILYKYHTVSIPVTLSPETIGRCSSLVLSEDCFGYLKSIVRQLNFRIRLLSSIKQKRKKKKEKKGKKPGGTLIGIAWNGINCLGLPPAPICDPSVSLHLFQSLKSVSNVL